MCDRDCFNCKYKDCRDNSVTPEEKTYSRALDKDIKFENADNSKRLYIKKQERYESSEKGKAKQSKYWKTEKGKSAQKKYNHSEKGISARKRYDESEKGKERDRRKLENKVKSGKNAEYCKAYYYRKKAELLKNGI